MFNLDPIVIVWIFGFAMSITMIFAYAGLVKRHPGDYYGVGIWFMFLGGFCVFPILNLLLGIGAFMWLFLVIPKEDR